MVRIDIEPNPFTGKEPEPLQVIPATHLDNSHTVEIEVHGINIRIFNGVDTCSFCNNLSEIEVKPVALGRKNYLFSDTTAGADASAVIYSLVETTKANGLNMYHYLWYLLEELPQTDLSEEAFEKYLPWNPEVKTALEEKAQKLLED